SGASDTSADAANGLWHLGGTLDGTGERLPSGAWWDRGTMSNLNGLFPADSGWILSRASAINNAGQIVGTGVFAGQGHAFLLTPSAPPPPPPPALSIDRLTVQEGNAGTTAATFTLRLSRPSTQTVTVNYATADLTAVAGRDYAQASGALTFASGE